MQDVVVASRLGCQLGMFAKYWEAGLVKTRLAGAIGGPAAARFQRACVAALVARFGQAADRRMLCFTPAEQGPAFAALAGDRWRVTPQCAGDLGQRMRHYFVSAFATGVERAVLIGSDAPTLPAAYVDEAFDRLADLPVVLGPTDDGGYYLIGLSREVPEIFAGVDWGTSEVWRQTIDRLQAGGHRHHELPRWYDVDTFDDLLRLRGELTASLADVPALNSLRETIDGFCLL